MGGSRRSFAARSAFLLRNPSATIGSSVFDDDFSAASRQPLPALARRNLGTWLSQNSLPLVLPPRSMSRQPDVSCAESWNPHPWIDRIWFGAFTVLSAFAALYPVRLLRVLNYGRAKGLPGPRAVLLAYRKRTSRAGQRRRHHHE
jgi:hypothetical protein